MVLFSNEKREKESETPQCNLHNEASFQKAASITLALIMYTLGIVKKRGNNMRNLQTENARK